MDRQPTLHGQLLYLRPLRPADFDDLFAVASDPLIWEQHPVKDRCTEAGFRSYFSEALESGGALVAVDRETARLIGATRYHLTGSGRSEIEIGWTFLARSCWGGAYNGEMKRLMLRHAFQYVESVIFLVGLENRRSQKALEKLGAVREAVRPEIPGLELLYRITAP